MINGVVDYNHNTNGYYFDTRVKEDKQASHAKGSGKDKQQDSQLITTQNKDGSTSITGFPQTEYTYFPTDASGSPKPDAAPIKGIIQQVIYKPDGSMEAIIATDEARNAAIENKKIVGKYINTQEKYQDGTLPQRAQSIINGVITNPNIDPKDWDAAIAKLKTSDKNFNATLDDLYQKAKKDMGGIQSPSKFIQSVNYSTFEIFKQRLAKELNVDSGQVDGMVGVIQRGIAKGHDTHNGGQINTTTAPTTTTKKKKPY